MRLSPLALTQAAEAFYARPVNQANEAQPSERGACGELRLAAEAACVSVPALRAAAVAAADALARARAALFEAETSLTAAQDAADPRVISEAKAQAQRAYRRGYLSSADTQDRRRTATAWLRELDRLNRDARMAKSAFDRARRGVNSATLTVEMALRTAYAERIRAETAADACRMARARLAECEERDILSMQAETANRGPQEFAQPSPLPARPIESTSPEPEHTAATAADATATPVDEGDRVRSPLVIQRLMGGDRNVLRAISTDLAETTGRDATTFMLLLQELIEAITSSAAEAGFLEFDRDDPFWSQFSRDEARSIVQALARMGFRYDAREGWLGGRPPGHNEFSLALAHVGYDVRGIRLPPGSGLADLFKGAHVSVDEQLALRAPNLALEQMLELLGLRADRLGELWDDWGRLRPLLLAESPEKPD